MLRALYEYGKMHPDVVMPPGHSVEKIDYVVSIGADGSFLGVEKDGKKYLRPYFKITSKPVSEPLAEKACVSVGMVPDDAMRGLEEKRSSFLSYFEDGRAAISAFHAVADALGNDALMAQILDRLVADGCTAKDVVGFRYDGVLLHDVQGVREWWSGRCGDSGVKQSKSRMLDIVTGHPCSPVLTSGRGLKPPYLPDAQTSGAMLVTFNANAFESYGLRQNENAAMSAESNMVAMDALAYLVGRAYVAGQRIGNIRFIHWFAGKTFDPDIDLLSDMLFGTGDSGQQDDDVDTGATESAATKLVRSPLDGVEPADLSGYEYHIVLIAAQGARIAVLNYSRGDYGDLYGRLKQWRDDFSFTDKSGMKLQLYKPLGKMLGGIVMASESNSDNPFNGIKTQYRYIMQSCIDGAVLPLAVLSRALSRFQSDIVDGKTNYSAASWIKAYLARYERIKKEASNTMAYLNEGHPNPAYHCGRAMAVYAELQSSAKTVNAGVTERFYAACMRSPALVLGQLQGMANHWLEDLEYKNKKRILEDALRSAYGAIDGVLPKNLSMEDRGYFTMGYVQQQAVLNKAFNGLRVVKNDKEENENV